MTAYRFQSDLLLALIAKLQKCAPVELERILRRFGFRDRDITFRTTRSGKYWATINRWPWERPVVKCDVCHADADCPQIWPWTWSDIAPGVIDDPELHEITCDTRCGCGYLCRSCAESRLGRPIADDDIDTESVCNANRKRVDALGIGESR